MIYEYAFNRTNCLVNNEVILIRWNSQLMDRSSIKTVSSIVLLQSTSKQLSNLKRSTISLISLTISTNLFCVLGTCIKISP